MCRRSISAGRTCMRFRPTARKSLTRATSTRSKRPARTTKFLSCRLAVAHAKKISTSPGADTTPLYSPDGKYLAWRSQARAGFEADKWRLIVQDRQSGKTRDLTEKFDRSSGVSLGHRLANAICFAAEDHGEAPIYSVGLDRTADEPRRIRPPVTPTISSSERIAALYFTRMSIAAPNEIWRVLQIWR